MFILAAHDKFCLIMSTTIITSGLLIQADLTGDSFRPCEMDSLD